MLFPGVKASLYASGLLYRTTWTYLLLPNNFNLLHSQIRPLADVINGLEDEVEEGKLQIRSLRHALESSNRQLASLQGDLEAAQETILTQADKCAQDTPRSPQVFCVTLGYAGRWLIDFIAQEIYRVFLTGMMTTLYWSWLML